MEFVHNEHSEKGYRHQYASYLQQSEYALEISGAVNFQSNVIENESARLASELKAVAQGSIQNSELMAEKICGSLDDCNSILEDINSSQEDVLDGLRNIDFILTSGFQALHNQSRIANKRLSKLIQVSYLSDEQKQKKHAIEKGLRYLNAARQDNENLKYSVSFFKKALALDKHDYVAAYYLGLIYLSSRKYFKFSKAKKLLTKAADHCRVHYLSISEGKKIKSNFRLLCTDSWYLAGHIRWLEGEYYEALKYLRGVKQFSDSPRAYFLMGKCYLKLDRESDASASFSKCLWSDRNYIYKYLTDPYIRTHPDSAKICRNIRNGNRKHGLWIIETEISYCNYKGKIYARLQRLQSDLSTMNYLKIRQVIDRLHDFSIQFDHIYENHLDSEYIVKYNDVVGPVYRDLLAKGDILCLARMENRGMASLDEWMQLYPKYVSALKENSRIMTSVNQIKRKIAEIHHPKAIGSRPTSDNSELESSLVMQVVFLVIAGIFYAICSTSGGWLLKGVSYLTLVPIVFLVGSVLLLLFSIVTSSAIDSYEVKSYKNKKEKNKTQMSEYEAILLPLEQKVKLLMKDFVDIDQFPKYTSNEVNIMPDIVIPELIRK